MVAVAPFRGLRFDLAVIGDPGLVVTPPSDVITAQARALYERLSPYNVVRLAPAARLGDHNDPGRYERVAKLLAAWQEEGALRLDPQPSLYLYEETYAVHGEQRVQRGMLGCVDLDDSGRWVLPHEGTTSPPVADLLRQLEATRANLSPVFGLYAGSGQTAALLGRVTASTPAINATDPDGIRHQLWPVTDPATITAWCKLLDGEQVLIADGHHRWRAALAYRDAMRRAHPQRRDGPWERTLAYLVDGDRYGPSVLANHRVLKGIPGGTVLAALAADFDAAPLAGPAQIEDGLAALPPAPEALGFGLYAPGQSWLLVARDPAALAGETGLGRWPLDVEVLHGPVLAGRLGVRDGGHQGVSYTYGADLARAAHRIDGNGGHSSLLALRPAPFHEVLAIAEAGETLPPKTTFFHPKPRDGLVLRPLEPLRRP